MTEDNGKNNFNILSVLGIVFVVVAGIIFYFVFINKSGSENITEQNQFKFNYKKIDLERLDTKVLDNQVFQQLENYNFLTPSQETPVTGNTNPFKNSP
jgi:uncharacterized membrane protein YukC